LGENYVNIQVLGQLSTDDERKIRGNIKGRNLEEALAKRGPLLLEDE
jgi:hypothetical protein